MFHGYLNIPQKEGGFGWGGMVFETITPQRSGFWWEFYALFHGYLNIPPEGRRVWVGQHGI